ncbi:CoA transferase [Yinghuangia sp. ASG 101]|uniref:CoA transferase n=1 Tax=Yinghuangia sp. ASG 101 TaxID=2896848 RepID=UPI001E506916|nr:CoA transferase [Yinghuangia sp. ASG 101]UGQ13133.1 CoA transferase [Yinghuangia sp. ASG 101]
MRPSAALLLDEAWRYLGGDPAYLRSVTFTGRPDTLPARLPVTELAQATAAAAGAAASELAAVRAGGGPGDAAAVAVDSEAVAIAFTSERHLRLNGAPQGGMDPLSKFFACADGLVRVHGNYPHHRAALFRALEITGTPDDPAETVALALLGLPVAVVEERVRAAGGLAFAVREPDAWRAHPHGSALSDAPLLTRRRIGAAAPGRLGPLPTAGGTAPAPPAAGVRVLDLTRVVAGPVGTRTLALLGAQVLRIDPPHLPEIPAQHLDTGLGKRSALLDLRTPDGLRTLDDLLAEADVVVAGYRPGALARFGLAPDELAARHPGLVVATLSAWGTSGPWSDLRGFDSLVQAPTGIARIEADGDEHPGVLPAQALDHGTGYLVAAGVLRALTDRQADGVGAHVEFALARTAAWLLRHHDPDEHLPRFPRRVAAADHLGHRTARQGRLAYALPPFALDGGPTDWSEPPVPWGSSPPTWW